MSSYMDRKFESISKARRFKTDDVIFEDLIDKITTVAMSRISNDGHPTMYFGELCSIMGAPQPPVDHLIKFRMDFGMLRKYILGWERKYESRVEIFTSNSFMVWTKEGPRYMMTKNGKEWEMRVFSASEFDGEFSVKINREFIDDIFMIARMIGGFYGQTEE